MKDKISRADALKLIFDRHGDSALYVTNTGYISRAVYNLHPENKNILYMQGSMGLAPAIALGLAMNTSKNVVAISGDGALLMHLGITHTIRDQNLKNLFVYVLDNGCHESVGSYECSRLEATYPGVTEIIPITRDGKVSRVGMSFVENRQTFKKCVLPDHQ